MKTTPPNSDLVYRPIQHQPHLLVVATRADAFHVHQIASAIEKAKTWKQFAAMLPPGEWQRIMADWGRAEGAGPKEPGRRGQALWVCFTAVGPADGVRLWG